MEAAVPPTRKWAAVCPFYPRCCMVDVSSGKDAADAEMDRAPDHFSSRATVLER